MKATLVINQETGVIESNFEEVKSELQEYLGQYKDAVFTEDSKTIAKKFVASLRAEKKQAADRIREKKAEFMVPWNDFEAKAKELLALYDEPIELIDSQVKAFEDLRKEEKRKLIQELYDSCVGDLSEYIPLDRIYDRRWENAGTSKKAIQEDMMSVAYSASKAVDTIKGMNSDAIPAALKLYKKNLSLSDAIAHINNYEQTKADIERKNQEKIKREEEERIRREEREKMAAELKAEEELKAVEKKAEEEKAAAVAQAKEETAQEVIDGFIPEMSGDTNLYEYRFSMPSDAKEKLEMFCDSVGIEWEMI